MIADQGPCWAKEGAQARGDTTTLHHRTQEAILSMLAMAAECQYIGVVVALSMVLDSNATIARYNAARPCCPIMWQSFSLHLTASGFLMLPTLGFDRSLLKPNCNVQ